MDGIVRNISNTILLILFSPLILLAVLLIIPLLIIGILYTYYEDFRDKIKLKALIKDNEGQVFFIYADYNQVNLSQHIMNNYEEIKSVKVIDNRVSGLLEKHLILKNYSKCYPRLTKIDKGKLVHKVHYDSFKKLVKKNNDIESFYELLDKSISNLKRL